MTSPISDGPVTTTPEPETVFKATGEAKGLKSRRILSVREMVGNCLHLRNKALYDVDTEWSQGNKRRIVSPPKVDREEEVVEREEGGGEEEEEREVKKARVEREGGKLGFRSFDYQGTNFTDFTQSKGVYVCVCVC